MGPSDTVAAKPVSAVVESSNPEQEALLLCEIPEEVLVPILGNLSAEQARQARPVCDAFNRCMGDVLSVHAGSDLETLKASLPQIKPQQGLFMGRTITVVRSATENQASLQAKRQKADALRAKLTSFKLYLTYLETHGAQGEKVQAKKAMLNAGLRQLQTETDAALDTLSKTVAQIPTINAVQSVAGKIFGWH